MDHTGTPAVPDWNPDSTRPMATGTRLLRGTRPQSKGNAPGQEGNRRGSSAASSRARSPSPSPSARSRGSSSHSRRRPSRANAASDEVGAVHVSEAHASTPGHRGAAPTLPGPHSRAETLLAEAEAQDARRQLSQAATGLGLGRHRDRHQVGSLYHSESPIEAATRAERESLDFREERREARERRARLVGVRTPTSSERSGAAALERALGSASHAGVPAPTTPSSRRRPGTGTGTGLDDTFGSEHLMRTTYDTIQEELVGFPAPNPSSSPGSFFRDGEPGSGARGSGSGNAMHGVSDDDGSHSKPHASTPVPRLPARGAATGGGRESPLKRPGNGTGAGTRLDTRTGMSARDKH